MLERRFYEETCKLLGIRPESSKPLPIAQLLDIDADDDAILRNPLYRKMKFNAIDIKYFHDDEKGLIEYVRMLRPNAIVLDWSYSKDGDVARVLSKSGILAELVLRGDLISYPGINGGKWVNLDVEQTRYLHEVVKGVENDKVTHFVIYGGPGTGKSMFGVQTAKITMSKLKEKSPMECVLFVVFCNSLPDLLQNGQIFNDEDCIKLFFTLEKLKEVSGIEKDLYYWQLNDIFCGIQIVFDKKFGDQRFNKIVFIDDLDAESLLDREQKVQLEDQFNEDKSMYTITCVSPVLRKSRDHFVKEKLEKMDEKSLLLNHQIMLRQFNVTYRNSHEIQLFYNIYQAHLNAMNSEWNVLTGMMKQPQMSILKLPFGPKPTIFITNKELRESSDDELTILKTKIKRKISGPVKGLLFVDLFIVCINDPSRQCSFCNSLNKEYSTSEPFHTGATYDYSGYTDYEKNTVIIHLGDSGNASRLIEFFSKARINLSLIVSRSHLTIGPLAFSRSIREILRHDKRCTNKECKENGWDKLKVVDVEYIGLTEGDLVQNCSIL